MRDQLRRLLDKPFGTDLLPELCEHGRQMFAQDGSLPSFAAWSVFRLMMHNLDDSQAVPAAVFDRYKDELLPLLKSWTATETGFCDTQMIGQVVARLQQIGAAS